MSIENNRYLSKLSFRISFIVGTVTGLLTLVLTFLLFEKNLLYTFITAFFAMFSSGGIAYLSIIFFVNNRLSALYNITENIAQKQFDDYENLSVKEQDELDELTSELIRANKMIEREIQRLNRIENYRKEFIGDISHELKTPIFAIQGFIETLLNGALEDEEVNREFLKKAMRNVNRLIYLTKDLMEISKLETGELKSEMQEVFLNDIINEVIESLQYKANKEDINILVEEFDKQLKVRVDRNQIKQVLINLVENAIKYNKPQGTVTVGVKPYSEDKSRIVIYVEDTGIGIEKHLVKRVTERFFRVDKSRSREKGGTGLGLSIVKHIMEAHGERLFIDSEPQVGSTFSFTLTKSNDYVHLH